MEKINQNYKQNDNLLKKLNDLGKIMQNCSQDELEQYQKKYQALCNTIVENNTLLVINIAKKFQNRGLDLDDLIQEGSIGLLKAIQRYDFNKGATFSTYATYWIKESIFNAVIDSDIIKKSRSFFYFKMKYNLFVNKYKMIYNCDPTLEEIAQELNVSIKTLKRNLKYFNNVTSLDKLISNELDITLGDIVDSNCNIENNFLEKELKKNIADLISKLNTREELIIRMHFGIPKDNNPLFNKQHSFKEIADYCNLTKERVRQIMKNSFVKMQRLDKKHILSEYESKEKFGKGVKTISFWNLIHATNNQEKIMKFNMLSTEEQDLIYKCFDNNLSFSNSYYDINKFYIENIINKLNNQKVILHEQYLWEKIACSKETITWLLDNNLIDNDVIYFLKDMYGDCLQNKFCELLIPLGKKKEYVEYINYLTYIVAILNAIAKFKNWPQLSKDMSDMENKHMYLQLIKLLPEEYQSILMLKLGLCNNNNNNNKYDIEEISIICSISRNETISLLEKGLAILKRIITIYEAFSDQNEKTLLIRENMLKC